MNRSSDPRIALGRRVRYGLMFLAGLRFGEAPGLHWSDYDAEMAPLGCLMIAKAYDSNNHRMKSVKTERPRAVPVHPVLAELLKEWRAHGWEEYSNRPHAPQDLLIPAKRGGQLEYQHKADALIELHTDLDMLGLRRRRQHGMRRTFISLPRADGARHDLLEMLTHGPQGDIMSMYTTMPWEPLCTEVVKLNLENAPFNCIEMGNSRNAYNAPNLQISPHVAQALSQLAKNLKKIEDLNGWGTRIRT